MAVGMEKKGPGCFGGLEEQWRQKPPFRVSRLRDESLWSETMTRLIQIPRDCGEILGGGLVLGAS